MTSTRQPGQNQVLDARVPKSAAPENQPAVELPAPNGSQAAGSSNTGNVARPGQRATCLTSAAPLAALKEYTEPKLESVRQELLAKDMAREMQSVFQRGSAPQAAVKTVLEQALEHDKKAAEFFSAAGVTAKLGISDVEAIQQLNGDSLRVATCSGKRNGAVCAAIASKMTALQYRRLAEEMVCQLQSGTGPR